VPNKMFQTQLNVVSLPQILLTIQRLEKQRSNTAVCIIYDYVKSK
jgi:hypothetical protein